MVHLRSKSLGNHLNPLKTHGNPLKTDGNHLKPLENAWKRAGPGLKPSPRGHETAQIAHFDLRGAERQHRTAARHPKARAPQGVQGIRTSGLGPRTGKSHEFSMKIIEKREKNGENRGKNTFSIYFSSIFHRFSTFSRPFRSEMPLERQVSSAAAVLFGSSLSKW